MKSAGKARNNGLYRHIRTSKEIIRNLLNDYDKYSTNFDCRLVILLFRGYYFYRCSCNKKTLQLSKLKLSNGIFLLSLRRPCSQY